MNITLQMYKRLGVKLVQNGIKMLNIAFNVKLKTMSSGNLKSLLASKGLLKTEFPDNKYWYPSIQTMRDILEYDWIDNKKYILNRFDCSSFSEVFKSHLKEIYGINCIGVVKHSEQVNANTGKHIAWHRFNIIIVDNNGLEVYALEPQNDKVVKIELNKRLIFGDKEYKIVDIEF